MTRSGLSCGEPSSQVWISKVKPSQSLSQASHRTEFPPLYFICRPSQNLFLYQIKRNLTKSMASRDKKPAKPSSSRAGGIRTLSDLNRPSGPDSDSDSDDPQEYYTGGEKRSSLFFFYFLSIFLQFICRLLLLLLLAWIIQLLDWLLRKFKG